MNQVADRDETARLGRALFFVQQQAQVGVTNVVKAKIGTLLATGAAMDLAVRLRGYRESLDHSLVENFAQQAGISHLELMSVHLPMLKKAGVVEFRVFDGKISHFEEYVGLGSSVINQTLDVLREMEPSDLERAVLHCVEIASWAPLARSEHLHQLAARGFQDDEANQALGICLALGVNKKVASSALREDVIFNPNVWSSGQEDIAKFLRGLPPAERDALLGLCEQASDRPALALPAYSGFRSDVMTSARRVGLIQSATVKSTAIGNSGAQTYVFSPVLESVDDQYVTTEALHQRKLFVAHILYGVEKARQGYGRVRDPVTLVGALARRGQVGPATNIGTDYHLLEAQGIVDVRPAGGGQAYLHAVKSEIIEGGLAWLEASVGTGETGGGQDNTAAEVLGRLRPPQTFGTPEAERTASGDLGEADEITTAAVLELRTLKQEAQRVVRFDF